MMEFFDLPIGAGSYTYVDVNLRVKQMRITRESDHYRFDMIDDKGNTISVLTFPDVKRDERTRRIALLEGTLEAIREAGGWKDPDDYSDSEP